MKIPRNHGKSVSDIGSLAVVTGETLDKRRKDGKMEL